MLVQDAHTANEQGLPAVVVEAGDALDLRTAVARNPGRDLVVTLQGAEMPFAWLERLRKGAYSAARIAAAVPLCDASPITALVDEALRDKARGEAARIDRTAYVMGQRACYEIPRLNPVCTYLRHEALQLALPHLPAGVDTPQRVLDALTKFWTATGWSSVACDFLYVGFPRALAAAPTFEDSAFLLHHPLGGLRRAVNDAIREGLPPVSAPGLDARPVQLHILHFWGGGLDRWVRDFGREDQAATNMLLATYRIGETGGQRIVLYSDPAALVPVRVWDIARPIRSTASGSIEYRRILDQVIREYDVESVIVSSLIGHALDALDLPVRTIVVCHDFYPVCQAINPRFGKVCEHCTLEDLRRCGEQNPLNSIFKDTSSEDWHAMRTLFVERLVARRIEVVAPSPFVAAELKRLAPRLADHPIRVIPHGIDLEGPMVGTPARAAGERLRLVVLGRLSVHKGTDLLRAASAALKPLADVVLLGCGKNGLELAQQCGWTAIERYELDALPELLRTHAPHAGLLASVIPETFSYTLSELQALGIPPLATDLGSFHERIGHAQNGFLFAPEPQALVALVGELVANPALLERVARNLAAAPRHRTAAQMVQDYRALLPAPVRPVARFRVGIGEHTALTEPYRQLSEAYAHLEEAYAQSADAYAQTKVAYDGARTELERFKRAWERWRAEYMALQARDHWWRAPRALRLLRELPRRLSESKGEGESE